MEKTQKIRLFHLHLIAFKKIYTMRTFVQKNITWEVLPKIKKNDKWIQINLAKEEFVLFPLDMNQLSNQYPKGLGMGPSSTNYFRWCHGVIRLVIVLGKATFYITSSIEYGVARLVIIYISQFEQLMEAHSVASCIGNTSPHPTFIHA
jgi:hypothetical protein